MIKNILFFTLLSIVVLADDSTCVSPGTCTPPDTKYKKLLNVLPRKQWHTEVDHGFPGAVSIQTIALAYGAYISQDIIRKSAIAPGGTNVPGNPTDGYKILSTNIASTLHTLSLQNELWDNDGQQKPQSSYFLQWTKWNLVQGNGLVVFTMLKGDNHTGYGLGTYDHLAPVWGLYSNNVINTSDPVNNTKVFGDDWLVHGSDHQPDGDANLGYFRLFLSMPDTTNMTGNCIKAQANRFEQKTSQMYPCINDQSNYGAAIRGLVDPQSSTYPLTLYVSELTEPDIRNGEKAVQMFATIHVTGLTLAKLYSIYRFDDPKNWPQDSVFNTANYTKKYDFQASGDTYQWIDGTTVWSNGTAYYGCIDHVSEPIIEL